CARVARAAATAKVESAADFPAVTPFHQTTFPLGSLASATGPQKQMLELNEKVDSLHRLLEQLTDKVTGIAAFQARYQVNDLGPDSGSVNQPPVAFNRSVDPSMTHKDILSDEPQMEGDKSNSSHTLSPEIQIQRLTAQLTAAYNRMAALEEQIMACRFQ
ncbi:MAG: hypothetical protein AAGE59_13815, partial [Cyanobacteria bacterium P01_F01_bin.86]